LSHSGSPALQLFLIFINFHIYNSSPDGPFSLDLALSAILKVKIIFLIFKKSGQVFFLLTDLK
jgi:hypothetical protein